MVGRGVGGEHGNRKPVDLPLLFASADAADGLDAVHDRHLHVHHDQVVGVR